MQRGGKKQERKEKHEVERCYGVCILSRMSHVMPKTTLSPRHIENWIRCQSRKKKVPMPVCVGQFLISTHLLNTANREILPFQRSKN